MAGVPGMMKGQGPRSKYRHLPPDQRPHAKQSSLARKARLHGVKYSSEEERRAHNLDADELYTVGTQRHYNAQWRNAPYGHAGDGTDYHRQKSLSVRGMKLEYNKEPHDITLFKTFRHKISYSGKVYKHNTQNAHSVHAHLRFTHQPRSTRVIRGGKEYHVTPAELGKLAGRKAATLAIPAVATLGGRAVLKNFLAPRVIKRKSFKWFQSHKRTYNTARKLVGV
jgi:hypothetical protein